MVINLEVVECGCRYTLAFFKRNGLQPQTYLYRLINDHVKGYSLSGGDVGKRLDEKRCRSCDILL